MSRHTPVSMGSVSSRLAAGHDLADGRGEHARRPPCPASGGAAGSAGYSSAGSETSANSALPQVTLTTSSSVLNSTAARAGCG